MLVSELDPDMQETWGVYGLYPNFEWLPADAGLVYWAKGKLWRVAFPSGEITEIPFHVEDERTIFDAPRPQVAVGERTFTTQMVRFARTSPSGEGVVFESLGKLWLKRADAPPEPLTNHGSARHEYSPVWAPDSKFIYFLSWTDGAGVSSSHIGSWPRRENMAC